MQQGHIHLQGQNFPTTQKLCLSLNFGRHQVQNGNPQWPNILMLSAFLSHDKNILAFENGTGRKCVRNFYWHTCLTINLNIKSLIEIPQNVVDIFSTDAQADEVGCDTGLELLFFG